MQVRGIHHVSINVHELDPAMRFYVEGLGFRELPRPDFGFAGAWLEMGAHQLHLIETPGAAVDPRQHFALQVDDLDACVAEIEAKGLPVRRSPDIAGAGRQAFVRDPSGNRIELNEPGT